VCAAAALKCSFSRDGFTYNIQPDGCPDLSCGVSNNCGVNYCTSVHDEFWWKCGWHSHELAQMMTMHEALRAAGGDHTDYNELVLDVDVYLHNLPCTIEAFFAAAWASDEQRGYVRAAHGRFTQAYPHASVPLLVYDPRDGASAPFKLMSE
jgi:hypothetical protein